MSQAANFGVPLVGPATPPVMAGRMDDSLRALLTNNSGPSRPTYAEAGTIWLDTATAIRLIKYFDGADDIVIARIDEANNIATMSPTRQEVVKTAAYTVTLDDAYVTLVLNSASARTFTLPVLSSTKSELFAFRNIGAGDLILDGNASELIEGALTLTVPTGAFVFLWPANGAGSWRAAVTYADVLRYGAQSLSILQQRQGKQNIGVPFSLYTNAGAADYAVVAADNGRTVDANTQAASRNVTLPSAATVGVGFVVTIRKIGTGFNTVTITANGSDVINIGGTSTYLLRLPDQGVTLQVTEAGIWRVVSEHGTVYSGSNANGEYTRLADGTQHCKSPAITVGAVNTASGSSFVSSTATWTFPQAFSAQPNVAPTGMVTTQWAGIATPSTTSVLGRAISTVSDATSREMFLTAKGRWF